uniref:Uncharacterized protein n=1 Tax=Romanomermis culicivorax TaxID=13658 RepID=A0A915J5M2_ROMCU
MKIEWCEQKIFRKSIAGADFLDQFGAMAPKNSDWVLIFTKSFCDALEFLALVGQPYSGTIDTVGQSIRAHIYQQNLQCLQIYKHLLKKTSFLRVLCITIYTAGSLYYPFTRMSLFKMSCFCCSLSLSSCLESGLQVNSSKAAVWQSSNA